MSVASSSSSMSACCSHCLTDARNHHCGGHCSPSSPMISWIWTMAVISCFPLVPKQYGRALGLKSSSPYITCRALIFMNTSTESGPGMSFNHQAYTMVINKSSVSLLPAPLQLFFKGSADISIASRPNPQSSELGISSSSLLSSGGSFSSVG